MRPKSLKKCMELYWNFQRGGEVLGKTHSVGGGIDIFWNYTLQSRVIQHGCETILGRNKIARN